jgi:hypothetical protein
MHDTPPAAAERSPSDVLRLALAGGALVTARLPQVDGGPDLDPRHLL